jgi:hypothetical protein
MKRASWRSLAFSAAVALTHGAACNAVFGIYELERRPDDAGTGPSGQADEPEDAVDNPDASNQADAPADGRGATEMQDGNDASGRGSDAAQCAPGELACDGGCVPNGPRNCGGDMTARTCSM